MVFPFVTRKISITRVKEQADKIIEEDFCAVERLSEMPFEQIDKELRVKADDGGKGRTMRKGYASAKRLRRPRRYSKAEEEKILNGLS